MTTPGSARSILVDRNGSVRRLVSGSPSHDDLAPLTPGHLFDLASLTKLFVAVAALSVAEEGLDLDAPVVALQAVGRGAGADGITLRQLLTHTSGLPASSDAWTEGTTGAELLSTVLETPLEAPPGARHLYSCLGYIAAGRVLEEATGADLAAIVARRVLLPLGSTATYAPDRSLAVATERQAGRGLVQGDVHDELANALGRPVGNAGLFGTADDVAALGRMVLAGGDGRNGRVLRSASVDLLTQGTVDGAGYRQAIGFRVADPSFMGPFPLIGHTGFTGTSLVVQPEKQALGVLLTNRVHDGRDGTDISAHRRQVAFDVAG